MLDPKTLGTILRQAELARTSALRQLAVLAPGREIATSLRAIVEAQTQASEALNRSFPCLNRLLILLSKSRRMRMPSCTLPFVSKSNPIKIA